MSDVKANMTHNPDALPGSQVWLRRTLGALTIAAGPSIGVLAGLHMSAEKVQSYSSDHTAHVARLATCLDYLRSDITPGESTAVLSTSSFYSMEMQEKCVIGKPTVQPAPADKVPLVDFNFNDTVTDNDVPITIDLHALERTELHEQAQANSPHYPLRVGSASVGAILGLAMSSATVYLNMLAFQIGDEQDAQRRKEEEAAINAATRPIPQ